MVRRGFAAEADRISASTRAELHIVAGDRLAPRQLAEAYGIGLASITELVAEGANPASIHQLTVLDAGGILGRNGPRWH